MGSVKRKYLFTLIIALAVISVSGIGLISRGDSGVLQELKSLPHETHSIAGDFFHQGDPRFGRSTVIVWRGKTAAEALTKVVFEERLGPVRDMRVTRNIDGVGAWVHWPVSNPEQGKDLIFNVSPNIYGTGELWIPEVDWLTALKRKLKGVVTRG